MQGQLQLYDTSRNYVFLSFIYWFDIASLFACWLPLLLLQCIIVCFVICLNKRNIFYKDTENNDGSLLLD
jgi:hypothetical protein